MNQAKFVKEIEVTDPDTKGTVTLSVFKHEAGGMFAINSSFLLQVLGDELWIIPDPFSNNGLSEQYDDVVLCE